ncbi:MAG: phytanoyl-CoA dioxygenase family protein [Pseudomonadales bacterium]|nr:phytanoyl-CoA dioxygenase family protein [Pseudomonadales bacterium]MDG1441609.1 phytanoyl-CoA dioxygenase family protein [Pseudomonadales bacterium]
MSEKQNQPSSFSIHEESDVGWDIHTPVNETVDAQGHPFPDKVFFGVPDPRAPKRRAYDDPEVEALRQRLKQNNGIRGLDICEPDQLDQIARIFHRDGFVVVRNLLNAEQLDRFRVGCVQRLQQILNIVGEGERKYVTESYRLPHRYSLGTSSASRELLHDPIWASMVDLPTTTPILEKIFGSLDYRVRGAGGDLCLPGAVEYQHLHSDVEDEQVIPAGRIEQAIASGVDVKLDERGEPDLLSKRLIMEMAPGYITINFLMSDLTWENGPIRQVPGTHITRQLPPTPEQEPEWMRLSTLVGAKAGDGVIRDLRAWHGATPNLSRSIRAMPNVEYVSPWVPETLSRQTMPDEIWQSLTAHGKRICRLVKADPGVWPAGAGEMHPIASSRKALKQQSKLSAKATKQDD